MTTEEKIQETLIKILADRFCDVGQEKLPQKDNTEESKIALEMIQSNTIFQLFS